MACLFSADLCNVVAGVYSHRYSLDVFLEYRFQLKSLSFWRLVISPCDLPNDLAKLFCFLSWEINYFTSQKI